MLPSSSTVTKPSDGASTSKSENVIGTLPMTCTGSPVVASPATSASTVAGCVTPWIVRSPISSTVVAPSSIGAGSVSSKVAVG